MTNRTFRGLMTFTAVFAAVACAFAAEKKLDNVHWNQTFPYNSYFLQCSAMPNGSAFASDYAGRHPVGCVQTAYAQVVAYHEWPAIIDDEYDAYGAFDANANTYVYVPRFRVSGHEPIDWDLLKNGSKANERFCFEMGRVNSLVAAFAFPLFSAGGTASTVSCPHYNPWFETVTHYGNPAEAGPSRDELFAAVKDSIDAGLPVAAGFQSAQGTHAVVLQGYRMDDSSGKVTDLWANLGWGGSGDVWSSYALSPAVGKNNSVVGCFPMHAPRKMVQLAPISAVAAPQPTIRWFAPKYWAPQIERFAVGIAKAEETVRDWCDPFTRIVTQWPTAIMCGGADKDDETHPQTIFKVQNGELQCYMPFDPRYYEWPDTFVATENTVLDFESNVSFTDRTHAEIQIKIANQPWRRLFDLNEGGIYDMTGGAGWLRHVVAVENIAGQPFKIRLAMSRYMRGSSNEYLWKFRNFGLKSVRTFAAPAVSMVDARAREMKLESLTAERPLRGDHRPTLWARAFTDSKSVEG